MALQFLIKRGIRLRDLVEKFALRAEFWLLLKANPQFGRLFVANILSKIGNQMHRFGLPWIVYDITGSAQLMAINFTVSLIPGFFFGFLGGVLADRQSRKKILIIGDVLAASFTLFIVLLHFSSFNLNVGALFALTFILSSINAIYLPSFQASLPSLLKKEDVIVANSFFSVSQSFINLGGPVFAGMLIGFAGPWANLVINAFSFILSGFLLLGITSIEFVEKVKQETKPKFIADLKYCLDIIKESKWLVYGLFLTFGVYLGAGSVGSLIQYFLRENLRLSGTLFGVTFALFEFVPMLLMGYYAPQLSKKFNMENLILVGSIVYAFSLIGIGLTTIYPVVIISGMLLNAAAVLIMVNWESMIQIRVPSHALGRITGTVYTFQSTALPIGGAISSFLVSFVSAQWVFIGFGLVVMVFVLITLKLPFASLEKKVPNTPSL